MCSNLKQCNTAYEREDGYYGQYCDTLSISFSNILQHNMCLPRMFKELYSVAIKGLRNLGIEELETVCGKFMNSSILQSFNSRILQFLNLSAVYSIPILPLQAKSSSFY